MKKSFFKLCAILILNVIPFNTAICEVYIVAEINQEVVTNVDLDFAFGR